MTSFYSYFFFRRQPAEFFFSKKNCQKKAGQDKIHLINPVKILQSPVAFIVFQTMISQDIFAFWSYSLGLLWLKFSGQSFVREADGSGILQEFKSVDEIPVRMLVGFA